MTDSTSNMQDQAPSQVMPNSEQVPQSTGFVSNKKLIIIGSIVIITIILVLIAVILSSNSNSMVNTNTQNTTNTQIDNNKQINQDQNNIQGFDNLPDNMCPQSIYTENGQTRGDLNNKPYIISDSQKIWIEQNCQNMSGLNYNNGSNNSQVTNETEPPLLLGSLGFNLEDYDASTGRAGDILFTNTKLPFDQIYSPYGQQDPRSPNDPSKRNPQPTVILPLGTKVSSIVTGEVVEVKELYSGDMTVWVAKDKNSSYFYETEHIKNPTVSVGDKVVAGQIIGEVSDYDSHNNPGFGLIEIGILRSSTDGGVPEHICPLNYLDPSIKTKTLDSLTKLYVAWNEYLGKEVYNYSTYATPGCVVLEGVGG